jgi:hypothetical protein
MTTQGKTKGWPLLLNLFYEQFNYDIEFTEQSLGFNTYTFDLSSWKLRLPEDTPVVWLKREDFANLGTRGVAESLNDVVRERNWYRRTILLVLDNPGQELRARLESSLENFVLIDQNDQHRVIHSRKPTSELMKLFVNQISLTALSPYEVASPVVGNRFFGRRHELRRILDTQETNTVILGIRRIGKTSLLREVERMLNSKNDQTTYVQYFDCSEVASSEDFVREVVRRLHAREMVRLDTRQKYIFWFPNFLERMKRMYGRRLVFLLDEFDYMIAHSHDYAELLIHLRSSTMKGVCQFVFAGYRETRDALNNQRSPFYNFATALELTEFLTQDAADLITLPMANLGVTIRNKDEIVKRIISETGGHPNLIQYYCSVLLAMMDKTGRREIAPENLIDVYNDANFRRHLIDSFVYNTSNLEKAIVYALLLDQKRIELGFTKPYIDALLNRYRIPVTSSQLAKACDTLALSGTFQQKGQEYFFTSRVFVILMERYENVKYLLGKLKEEGI